MHIFNLHGCLITHKLFGSTFEYACLCTHMHNIDQSDSRHTNKLCTTAGMSSRWSDTQVMKDEFKKSRAVQSRAEWYRAAYWSTQRQSQQFHSNLAAYCSSISSRQTGTGHQAATVICFTLGLAVLCRCHSLSVCLSISPSLCGSFTESCYFLYFPFSILIFIWY